MCITNNSNHILYQCLQLYVQTVQPPNQLIQFSALPYDNYSCCRFISLFLVFQVNLIHRGRKRLGVYVHRRGTVADILQSEPHQTMCIRNSKFNSCCIYLSLNIFDNGFIPPENPVLPLLFLYWVRVHPCPCSLSYFIDGFLILLQQSWSCLFSPFVLFLTVSLCQPNKRQIPFHDVFDHVLNNSLPFLC